VISFLDFQPRSIYKADDEDEYACWDPGSKIFTFVQYHHKFLVKMSIPEKSRRNIEIDHGGKTLQGYKDTYTYGGEHSRGDIHPQLREFLEKGPDLMVELKDVALDVVSQIDKSPKKSQTHRDLERIFKKQAAELFSSMATVILPAGLPKTYKVTHTVGLDKVFDPSSTAFEMIRTITDNEKMEAMVVWGITLKEISQLGASNSVRYPEKELADVGSELSRLVDARSVLSSQMTEMSSQMDGIDQRVLELTERALELTKLAQTLGTSREGSYANSGMTGATADNYSLDVRSVDTK